MRVRLTTRGPWRSRRAAPSRPGPCPTRLRTRTIRCPTSCRARRSCSIRITQLEWARAAASDAMDWQTAAKYCADLSAAGGGFRLPSRIELLSLLDPSRVSPALDADVFPDQPGSPYWSDSPLADNHDRRWAIEMQFSTQFALPRELDKALRVRCVRDKGQLPATGRFNVEGPLVHDLGTQLTWQSADAPNMLSHADALAYCTNLDLNGKGFRLPTLKELHTLVDEARTLPAADSMLFPDTDSEGYWSSTALVEFPRSAWIVNFARGIDGFAGVDTSQHVRCVR
ncbi:MAG: DUF1566 domain-containing protein [Myxococcales bacterium]